MKRMWVPVAALLLLLGCLGGPGYLESLYGGSVPPYARACITDSQESDPVFYECISGLAENSANSSLCESVFPDSGGKVMLGKRDSCILKSESGSRNPAFCESVAQPDVREFCLATVSSSPQGCLLLPQNSSDCIIKTESVEFGSGTSLAFRCVAPSGSGCLLSIAESSADPGPCYLITQACDVDRSAQCRKDFDYCFMRTAELTGNSSLCRELDRPFLGEGLVDYSPEKLVNDCALSAFNSPDRLKECRKLSGRQRGECVIDYAVSKRDPSVCSIIAEELRGIVDFPVRQEDFAQPHSDWSVYTLAKSHDECLANLAVNLKDPSICEGEFLVDKGSAICFFELALSTKDASLCSRISDPNTSSSCELNIE